MTLDALFRPRGVAVVGASPTPGNLAGRSLRNLRRFAYGGALVAVNPNYTDVDGVPCYPSLIDVPDRIDLVLVLVPATRAHVVLEECAVIGARAAIVFSSGFAEVGSEGRADQEALTRWRERGVRVLGPNCQGMIFLPAAAVATFTAAVDPGLLPSSQIAYVGQSGAVGGSVLDLAREAGIGLTAWVSTGNQADLDVTEVADYLLGCDDVSTLMLYFEQQPDGAAWRSMLERAAEVGKRIIVLAAGRSEVGRRAAISHTGAMVSPDTAFRLTSSAAAVIEVDDIDELLLTASTLRSVNEATGRRVAVVTTSGGAGSLAADHLDEAGFELPQLEDATQEELSAVVPDFGSTENPIDVTAQLFKNGPETFGDVCVLVGDDRRVDIVMIVLTMIGGDAAVALAECVARAANSTDTPLVVVWLAGAEQTGEARKLLREASIAVFDSVGDAARTLDRVSRPTVMSSRVPADLPDANAAAALAALVPRTSMTEADSAELLDHLGLPHPRGMLVAHSAEARDAAAALGTNVVMKVQSPDLAHKSEYGGVRVGVDVDSAASVAAELVNSVMAQLPNIQVDGVLVQERAAPGIELLIGVRGQRNGYPPVVTVGMGGVATELYSDVVSALAPIDQHGARELLRRLRGWPLLDGYRGTMHSDVDAAAEAIAALSDAAVLLGERLIELEVNPVIVHELGDGVSVVDFLLRTSERDLPTNGED